MNDFMCFILIPPFYYASQKSSVHCIVVKVIISVIFVKFESGQFYSIKVDWLMP